MLECSLYNSIRDKYQPLFEKVEGGVDLYFHTFVLWASEWGWIEHTLNSRRSPPETEVFLSFSLEKVVLGSLKVFLYIN